MNSKTALIGREFASYCVFRGVIWAAQMGPLAGKTPVSRLFDVVQNVRIS